MLEAEGIKKSYRSRLVLKDASLQAEPGSCVGIAGSNGCGKTTLLSILAGAQKADGGTIRLNGVDTAGHREIFTEKIAYVPQENPLIPELTVRDNLSLWYKGSRKRLNQDLEEGPAALLGIPAMLSMTAGRLSGGMKKRLSIACALSNHAPVLIMDEPGAALDLECKELIRDYIRQYVRGGGTVILTSHEIEELSLSSKMYVMRGGMLQQIEAGLSAQELIEQFQ